AAQVGAADVERAAGAAGACQVGERQGRTLARPGCDGNGRTAGPQGEVAEGLGGGGGAVTQEADGAAVEGDRGTGADAARAGVGARVVQRQGAALVDDHAAGRAGQAAVRPTQ